MSWRPSGLLSFKHPVSGFLPLSLLCLSATLAVGCDDGSGDDDDRGTETGGDASYIDAEFEVRQSVEQLQITHATPGVELRVVDAAGTELQIGTTDELGSLIFRLLPPGEGYSVEEAQGLVRQAARDLMVWDVAGSYPEQAHYDGQTLQPGYNYITTRDGTQLSAYVTLPGPIEDGPYPTIINYSGYQPSKPGGPISDQYDVGDLDLNTLCPTFPVICDAPNNPSGLLGGFMGFATVGVNMRGTGCSGGAYDFFETLQVLDGYDLIETIATQDWVLNNKVATAGLSYPGISQVWVAQTRPPSLVAIAPMSIFAHTANSVMRPGGITNDGFALNWAERVLDNAVPYGQGWEQGMVDAGDTICEENQLLHGQLINVIEKAEQNPYYTAAVYDPLNPLVFAGEIDVPVFITGAWQDEQTGGHFAKLYNHLDSSPHIRMTMFNGVHADGYVPEHLLHWGAFLDFYVRQEVPKISAELRAVGPSLFGALLGDNVEFPPDPYAMFGSYQEAFDAYQAEDPINVRFEMGNSTEYETGIASSAYSMSFDQWPPAELEPQRWYFQPDGTLETELPPTDGGASSFHIDPADARTTTLPSGDVNSALPPYDWPQDQTDTAAVFVSAEFAEDVVMVGPASADLWVRGSIEEADVEINVIEVRPDGQEMYVQSGWLRMSERALDTGASSELDPVQTHLEADLAALPTDSYVEARINIFPFAHTFRAGSKIKISVDTPGASRPEWKFLLHESQSADVRVNIAHNAAAPSSVLFPVLPGVSAPTELAPCPSLRGQPCRETQSFENTPAD